MELNTIEKKLLYELDKNSRRSYNQIAKSIRKNKNTVRYNIDKLTKDGLIKKFFTIIDNYQLGYTQHKVFIRLQNLTPVRKEDIIKHLTNHQNITWVAICDGQYDLIFSIRAKTLKHLKKILMEFINLYGINIKEKTITTILEAEFFSRDYLLCNKRRDMLSKVTLGTESGEINYDTIDLRILAILSKNSRTPIVEIAKNLKLSVTTIIRRIKQLENRNIIQKYSIILDNLRLNQFHFKVLIGLHNITEEKEKSLFNYLRQLPNVFFIVNTLGMWEIEIDFEVKALHEFRTIMMELTNKFSDIIKDYSTLQIYSIYKYEFFCEENI